MRTVLIIRSCARPMRPEFSSAGHGKPVSTPDGRWFLVYLCSRLIDGAWGMLGRETALDELVWTPDGWPVIKGGRKPSTMAALPLPGEQLCSGQEPVGAEPARLEPDRTEPDRAEPAGPEPDGAWDVSAHHGQKTAGRLRGWDYFDRRRWAGSMGSSVPKPSCKMAAGFRFHSGI